MPAIPPHRSRPRLYHPDLPHPRLAERPCQLDPEQTRHVRKVLRCQAGDRVELFDGEGGLAQAVLTGFDGPRALCRVEHVDHEPPASPRITVAAALPKGSRPDDMIEQLSQVGADRFVPLRTERSVVDPRPQKLDRLQRQAVEAAKQCGRLHVMAVETVQTLDDVLKEPADRRLIAERDGALPMSNDALRGLTSLQVLIGPEGGWSERELGQAEAAEAQRWSMGPYVMRVETAAPAAVALLRYLTAK